MKNVFIPMKMLTSSLRLYTSTHFTKSIYMNNIWTTKPNTILVYLPNTFCNTQPVDCQIKVVRTTWRELDGKWDSYWVNIGLFTKIAYLFKYSTCEFAKWRLFEQLEEHNWLENETLIELTNKLYHIDFWLVTCF